MQKNRQRNRFLGLIQCVLVLLAILLIESLIATPTLALEKIGYTITEQDESKETDMWAEYLERETIQAIAVDKDCLWLGTGEGLIRFSKEGEQISLTYYTEGDGLPGRDVQAIKVYKGDVWIGTRDGGLSLFDGANFINYGRAEGLFDTRVMALDVDDNYVWLGLCSGCSCFEKRRETFHNYELAGGFVPQAGLGSTEDETGQDPRRIYADSILADGEYIWHGAWNVKRSNRNLTHSVEIGCGPLLSSRVSSICRAGDYLYIGTTGGLARVDTAILKVTNFTEKNGLLSNNIVALAGDGKFLWIGTDLGISRFDTESSKFTNFVQGYKGGLIFSMAVDKDYLWIGAMGGLVRLDKRAESGTSSLLDDFENPRWTRQLWNVPSQHVTSSGIRQIYFVDSTTGANGSKSSLCLTYELPPEPPEVKDNYHCFHIAGAVDKDLTPYEGITFFIKVEGPSFDNICYLLAVLEENNRRPEPYEGFHMGFKPVLGKWTRVVIPFTAFPRPGSQDVVNSILELRKVDQIAFEYAFWAWHPGEEMKFWIDEVSFYKKDEFTPTVPGGTLAVDRGGGEERALSIEDLPIKEEISPREAKYYLQLSGGKVQCQLCPNQCILKDGERGICRVRENIGGKLYTLVYGQPCSLAIDPIEKGPIFHMSPGAKTLTVATAGCNLNCKYCQNWQFALVKPEGTKNYDLSPEAAVDLALANECEAIVFTYTEATVFYEYMLDIAKLAHEQGLKNVLITAGYINPEPLRELCQYFDAIKVDLKGFSQEFYRQICSAQLQPVLETLKVIKEEGVWLEIVNLVIPTLNDDINQIRQMCQWIKENLGRDVPLHFSRFWPSYKLSNLTSTSVGVLEMAIQMAREIGLKYVYIGNLPGHEAGDTYCPKCGQCLVKRIGYVGVEENNIVDGKCKFCGETIPGEWK